MTGNFAQGNWLLDDLLFSSLKRTESVSKKKKRQRDKGTEKGE